MYVEMEPTVWCTGVARGIFPKWNGNSENLGNLINHQGMNCLSYAAWWCCRSILVSNARGWTNIFNVQSKFETNNLHWKHLGKTQTYWEHENRSNGPARLRSTRVCEVHLLFTLNVLRRRQKFFLSINQAERWKDISTKKANSEFLSSSGCNCHRIHVVLLS